MSEININNQLQNLPIIEDNSFFLKYLPTINEDYAKSLVGKLIYFTWYHKLDNEMINEELSGKVLDYNNNELLVYTHYVAMLEEDLKDSSDLDNNGFIEPISINDITHVAEFKDYVFEAWENVPEDYYGNMYEITNTENKTITALIYDSDGSNLYLLTKQNNNGKIEIVRNKYPISLIKEFKKV